MRATLRHTAILLGMLGLMACTPAAESVQTTGHTLKTAMHDNVEAWRGLFTYKPEKKGQQLPQTRYCYRMQSDTVCYDSPQPNMTARLVGYQDGTNISWVQPGGGSLGVSGGEPTAPYDANVVQVAPSVTGYTAEVMQTTSASSSAMTVSEAPLPVVTSSPAAAPFSQGESSYVKSSAN